jgi:lipid A 3-O-deacylase
MYKNLLVYGLVSTLVVSIAFGAKAQDNGYLGQPGMGGQQESYVVQSPQPSSQPPATSSAQKNHSMLDTNIAAAEADDVGRITVSEDNDFFASNDDRHYTQGARVSYLSGAVTPNGFWDAPYRGLNDLLPIFEGGDYKRKYDYTVIGQSIFTPKNLITDRPLYRDRPYAGWLYTGVGLLQQTHHQDEGPYLSHDTLEDAEILGGIVGPGAFANVTQNDFHQFIGVTSTRGWQNQLHNEPGLVLNYVRKWRFDKPLIGNFGVDAIPEVGGTAGNVYTYAETGGMVRMGQNLAADYGPSRIQPSLSGTSWFDKTEMTSPTGWYFFAGLQGRAVERNIFLDGNTVADSLYVNKKPLVADFTGGASLFWTDLVRLDLVYTERTKEFYGPQATQDKFGGFDVAFRF